MYTTFASATQVPLSAHAPEGHSLSSLHVRHSVASQIGFAVPQSMFDTHSTHVPLGASQTSVAGNRMHSVESVHATHTSVVTSHTGALTPHPVVAHIEATHVLSTHDRPAVHWRLSSTPLAAQSAGSTQQNAAFSFVQPARRAMATSRT